jgi:hypothetical protein
MKSAGGEDWDYIQGLSSAPHLPSAEPPALKGQKMPLSLFPLTFKKCKMSKRNGAVGKETVDSYHREEAEKA